MVIPFQHKYTKLSLHRFTTIRGVAFAKNLAIGDTVLCTTPWGNHHAKVVSKEIQRIYLIPLEVLKFDAEYPGFVINDHNDFVELVNSFRRLEVTHANKYSNVVILTLEWSK